MQEAERPIQKYLKKMKTGEIARIAAKPTAALLPRQAENTAVAVGTKPDKKPPTDKYGRAYIGLTSSEATPQAIASCVAQFLAMHGKDPALIELSDERYERFGIHYRQYYTGVGPTRIPIVACSQAHRAYDVICYGEAISH